ncbi:MAG: insulinase family protein [Deltaproteobacteria bacterium]|nr:insulinase family protein [Deltaproteobacteria bacterium]
MSRTEIHSSEIHYRKLDNGLTLLLRETHLAPVANLQIWAGVGSADERPEEAGLAHFHEHMLFKGTGRRGVGEIAGEVEGAGGRINAYTSFDVTVYHATLPAAALETGLDVLCDAVQGSVFDPEEMAREQEVVIEEIRRSQDAPGHVLGDLMFRQAYGVHPYRLPILGTAESVGGFDRDTILAFYRRWYTPDNLTVVAAGDFDAGVLAARIAEQFAGAAPGGASRQRAAEPRHAAPRTAVLRRPFESQRIELAWPSARFRDEDATHLDLLAFLLGECESSRLVRRLREEDGLVDRIDASSYTPLDRGLFSVGFESDEARSRRAVEAVAEEVERLRVEPVSSEELERARNNFLSSEHFERESVSGMASKLGSFEVIGGDWRREDRYFETLRGATREDLLRVAQEYLDTEQIAVAAVIPDREDQTLDESALSEAVTAGVERTRSRHSAPPRIGPHAQASAPALALRSDAQSDRAGEIHSFSLPGGATLHVAPRRSVPVVAARAAFSGGLLAETKENSGLSCFTASMWTRGTQRHTSTAFASAVEDLAADISGFSGRSSMGVTLEVTSDNLLPALDLFSDVLLRPGLREEDVERERRETLAAIERREDQLAQRSFMLFTETEFPLHPYRRPMLGDRPSVESFTAERIRAHHDWLIRASNMVMAVAGDVDPDAIAEAVSARLADLPAGRFDPLCPANDPIASEIREAHSRKDRAQAHMVLGFRGTTVDDPDRFVLEVISQLLAGQSGRLFLELRDKQSLAYSVSAMNVEGVSPGFFAIYIATAPDKVDSARRGILEQLERLVQDPPGEDELARTKRNLTGNFVIDQQRSAARAAHIALDGLYGLGPRAHRLYPEQIESIRCDDVIRVARRIIRLDAYTLALVGPD